MFLPAHSLLLKLGEKSEIIFAQFCLTYLHYIFILSFYCFGIFTLYFYFISQLF